MHSEVYDTAENSKLLPKLDLALLAQYAIAPDPLKAAIAFHD
ncbi:MAG: hypothetical protein SFY66_22580 [Oculatellaceae cyanobacterium bins.114]|nr:hypothetical protein [Oculatellaceae cyanobacterium bins.114]